MHRTEMSDSFKEEVCCVWYAGVTNNTGNIVDWITKNLIMVSRSNSLYSRHWLWAFSSLLWLYSFFASLSFHQSICYSTIWYHFQYFLLQGNVSGHWCAKENRWERQDTWIFHTTIWYVEYTWHVNVYRITEHFVEKRQ